jgi:hypothetical protein
MSAIPRVLLPMVLSAALAFPQAPPASGTEDAIQKSVPDRKLDQSDEPFGHYLWISTKNGNKFLYYFFGSVEWGKSKVGSISRICITWLSIPTRTHPPSSVSRTRTGVSSRFAFA